MFRSFNPDDLGNRTSAAYGNGTAQAFGYDPVSRLSSLTVDLAGTASDLTKTFAYNPASQIVTETRSNDAYAQVLSNSTQTTVTNGLNQLATVNGTAAAYDARGNMTTDPVTAKTYSYYGSNNQLWNVPSPFTTLGYDALNRLSSLSTGTPVTVYVSDPGSGSGAGGTDAIAEYDGSNVLQKRYAFDGSGQPLVQYDASGNRTWMVGDERGSVIALASDSGAMTSIDTYDEYGIPGAANTGTFQYAGMMWLSRPGVYAPTYRAYVPLNGRFSQTDPIGMAGGVNLYAYVVADPVNLIDPLGLEGEPPPVIVIACQNGGDLTANGTCVYPSFGSLSGGVGIGGGTAEPVGPDFECFSGQCQINVTQNRLPGMFPLLLPGLPVPINICPLVGLLGQSGRLRLGADVAGGYFGYARGGLGISLRGDLSLEFDAYLGTGIGAGLLGGAGVTLDNGGGISRGGQAFLSREASGGAGLFYGGLSFSAPNGGSVTRPNPNWSQTTGSFGATVGPDLGLAAGSTKTGTASYRTGGAC